MLFNSYIFIFLFLPITLIGYYILNHFQKYKAAMAFLVGMSLCFYGYNNIYYLGILIVSILLNYLIIEIMDRLNSEKPDVLKKICLVFGVALNIGILFYFKYYDFFIENMNSWFGTDFVLIHVMLPLGISFYTFQQLSYVIDYYQGNSEKYGLLEYAAYVTFFPQLIAGPIVYHSELIPQFRERSRKQIDFEYMSKGMYAFALGLAKKVLLADTFSKVVTVGYGAVGNLNTTSALIVMICYSLQIYFDFSGYCDMACGIGYFFHVELPVNFNSPYKAKSIVDFWDRWHITLTRFFTRYVYIPLGGSRKGKIRTYINIMIVFLISGIWHGANWTFILWGVINGIGNVIDKLCNKLFERVPKIIRVGVTFIFTTFAWSLFRADSIKQAKQLWSQVFNSGFGNVYEPILEVFNDLTEITLLYHLGFSSVMEYMPSFLLVAFMLLSMAGCFFMKNTQEKVNSMKYNLWEMLVTVVLTVWSILSLSQVSEFLYFNF